MIVSKPRLLFRPDPVLGWSLTPGHAVRVAFRDGVVQRIGADGWRQVPGHSAATGPRLAVYGCSFTYGTGLSDEETYVARLQAALPEIRLLNRGIGGQGTVQNLLQFRRDIAAGAVDAAIFAIISDHRFRNIPHPSRMRQYLSLEWSSLGVEHVPVLRRGGAGRPRIVYLPIWQPVIARGGFEAFLPDDWMITDATLAALDMIREEAAAHQIPVGFALLDALAPAFNTAVRARCESCVDISVPMDAAHTHRPHDRHPNAHANVLYAERLQPLARTLGETARSGERA